jgi:AcrR family transcriptional regulator
MNDTDPRVVRTRQLILDAFMALLNEKAFQAITVSDITKRATVNRATFYAHFTDKYALLDLLMADALTDFIDKRVPPQAELDSETVKQLILSLCDYHVGSSSRCVKHYDSIAPFVEQKVKLQLEEYMLTLMLRHMGGAKPETVRRGAVLVSWALYGATFRWNAEGRRIGASVLAEEIYPLLAAGLTAAKDSWA